MFFSTDKGKEVFVFLFISCREKKKGKIQDSPDTQILKSYTFVGNALSGNKLWRWHTKHPSHWGDEDTFFKGEISHWKSLAVLEFLLIKRTEIVTENRFRLDSAACSMISKRLYQLRSADEIFFIIFELFWWDQWTWTSHKAVSDSVENERLSFFY